VAVIIIDRDFRFAIIVVIVIWIVISADKLQLSVIDFWVCILLVSLGVMHGGLLGTIVVKEGFNVAIIVIVSIIIGVIIVSY